MTTQNYLQIQNDAVINVVVWDGNIQTWEPPSDATMLVQATTPAMIWITLTKDSEFVLAEVIGAGDIGFTWDGTILTTNQPKPLPLPTIPVV